LDQPQVGVAQGATSETLVTRRLIARRVVLQSP
jgi:hypothetical protein